MVTAGSDTTVLPARHQQRAVLLTRKPIDFVQTIVIQRFCSVGRFLLRHIAGSKCTLHVAPSEAIEHVKNSFAKTRDLWELRCEASHQAKTFYDSDVPGSKIIQSEIILVEYYLLGVLIFALDHLEMANTVDELWSAAQGYSLPEYALCERPADMPKLQILNFLIETRLKATGAGARIDAVYASRTAGNSGDPVQQPETQNPNPADTPNNPPIIPSHPMLR
jgi:hypothetical protein